MFGKRTIKNIVGCILVCVIAMSFLVVSCNNNETPDENPFDVTAETEINKLVGAEYMPVGDEYPLLSRYTDGVKEYLAVLMQIKSTGTIKCDYKLTMTYADDEFTALKVTFVKFDTAPQTLKDAVKSDKYEVLCPLGELKNTLVAEGSLKAGYADYIAVVIDVSAGLTDDEINRLIERITAVTESGKHVEIIDEE